MTARDPRTDLFLPNKQGEYGDNWRSLEHWARMTWQEFVPINGWVASTDVLDSTPPAFTTDGFGNLNFRGAIMGERTTDPFFVLPESARPNQRSVYAAASWVTGETTIWPGAIVVDVDGSCYFYVNLLDAVSFTLTGIFSGLFNGIFTNLFDGIFSGIFSGLTNLNNPAPVYGRVNKPTNQTITTGTEATVTWGFIYQQSGMFVASNAWQVSTAADEGRFHVRSRIKGLCRWAGRYTAHLYKEMTVTQGVLVSDQITFTTQNPHFMTRGDLFDAAGFSNSLFNGFWKVENVINDNQVKVYDSVFGFPDATENPPNADLYFYLDDDHPPYDPARGASDEYTLQVEAMVEMKLGDRLFVNVGNYTGVDLTVQTDMTWFRADRITAFANTGTAPADPPDPPDPPSPPDPPDPSVSAGTSYPADAVVVVSLSPGPVSLVPPTHRP